MARWFDARRYVAANVGRANDSKYPHDVQRNVPIGIRAFSGSFVAIQNDFRGGPAAQ